MDFQIGTESISSISPTNVVITVPWATIATVSSPWTFSNSLLTALPNRILAVLTVSEPQMRSSGLRMHSITND